MAVAAAASRFNANRAGIAPESVASANARCVCGVPENNVDGLVCNLLTRGEREYKGGSLCRYLLHLKAKGLS